MFKKKEYEITKLTWNQIKYKIRRYWKIPALTTGVALVLLIGMQFIHSKETRLIQDTYQMSLSPLTSEVSMDTANAMLHGMEDILQTTELKNQVNQALQDNNLEEVSANSDSFSITYLDNRYTFSVQIQSTSKSRCEIIGKEVMSYFLAKAKSMNQFYQITYLDGNQIPLESVVIEKNTFGKKGLIILLCGFFLGIGWMLWKTAGEHVFFLEDQQDDLNEDLFYQILNENNLDYGKSIKEKMEEEYDRIICSALSTSPKMLHVMKAMNVSENQVLLKNPQAVSSVAPDSKLLLFVENGADSVDQMIQMQRLCQSLQIQILGLFVVE